MSSHLLINSINWIKNIFILFYVYGCFACMFLQHAHAVPAECRGRHRIPRTGVKGLPSGCWELDQGLMEEKAVLLRNKASLQPLNYFLKTALICNKTGARWKQSYSPLFTEAVKDIGDKKFKWSHGLESVHNPDYYWLWSQDMTYICVSLSCPQQNSAFFRWRSGWIRCFYFAPDYRAGWAWWLVNSDVQLIHPNHSKG